MKVVVDTNVLISAFVFGGNAERVLEKVLASGELISSAFILTELERVLKGKFEIPADKINRILTSLNQVARVLSPDAQLPNICRDPDDNFILQLAAFADADFIVTGDKDLLVLEVFGKAQIVSPAVFLQSL
jgi:putative PIN family toxin of toxin-antitoxin system